MERWYPDRIVAGNIDDYLSCLADPAYDSSLIQILGQLFPNKDRSRLPELCRIRRLEGSHDRATGQVPEQSRSASPVRLQ